MPDYRKDQCVQVLMSSGNVNREDRRTTMAKRLTIRELTPDEYPDTQLRYEVRDETGEVVSLHYWEEDARQMAALPLMLEALEALTAVIRRSVLTPIVTDKAAVQQAVDQANAAIAAAKGE